MSPGGTSRPVTPSSTASRRPAHGGGHDGAAVRHRLARNDAVALAPARERRRRRPLVVAPELGVRHEADRLREQRAERPVADDDEGQAAQPPRRARARPSPRRGGRRRGCAAARRARATRAGDGHAARDHAHRHRAPSARASAASAVEAHTTARARRSTGRKSHGTRFASSTSDPQSCTTSGRSRGQPGDPGRQPVRVHDVRLASCTPRRAAEREEEEREQEHPPLAGAQVVGDAVAVGDPVVAKGGRRDDLHVDPGRTQVLDRLPHEMARHVARVPRVRRGEDDDPHRCDRSRRPNTAGDTTTKAANTKK